MNESVECIRCHVIRPIKHFPIKPDGSPRKICLVCFAMIPRKNPIPFEELRTYRSRATKRAEEKHVRDLKRASLEKDLEAIYPTEDVKQLADIIEAKNPETLKDLASRYLEPSESALNILEKARKK